MCTLTLKQILATRHNPEVLEEVAYHTCPQASQRSNVLTILISAALKLMERMHGESETLMVSRNRQPPIVKTIDMWQQHVSNIGY
jgi:hypothetical protein